MTHTHYEAQLARGYRLLRFAQPLEAEFRLHYRQVMRHHLRAASLGLAGMVVFASLANHLFFAPPAPLSWQFDWLMVGLLAPAMLALFWLLGNRGWERMMYPLSTSIAVLGSGFFVSLELRYAEAGVHYPFESFLFVIAYVFLLSGLRFPVALLLSVPVALAGLAVGVMTEPTAAALAERGYNMLAVMVITGCGGYLQELTARTNFLNNRVAAHHVRHDPLTGLNNRRGFDRLFDMGWRQALRDEVGMALLVLDIDHFKRFNDQYGHPAGDQCLANVSRALERAGGSRPLDFCARTGGEEFAMVLYNVDVAAAQQIAQRVRDEVKASPMVGGRADGQVVTVSIGLVNFEPRRNLDARIVIQRADQLLYLAKQAGRDCVRSDDLAAESASLRGKAAAVEVRSEGQTAS